MEYFKSGLKSVLGTPPPGDQQSGAETIERLVERLQSSTLLDDRRDACRALKAMSRKFRVEVGAQGMTAICHILETDHGDPEIVGYALDTLCNIVDPQSFQEEELPEDAMLRKENIGEQFTEMFINKADNVALVLGYLEESDFRVRWSTVKLLNHLLTNRRKNIQDIVLVSPLGVSKLMDLLADSREIIRNDTLLLLDSLTHGNANIQKIVAFENAFDRLFDVISDEGYVDGGIVVEDCLRLMLNLLKNNISNQNFFKEGSYIQKLSYMFQLPDSESEEWSAQREANILILLKVIRSLVTPGNPAQVVSSCQKVLCASGILESLCRLLMTAGVPAKILTETLNTVAEIIRGDTQNQEYFANLNIPSEPPRQAMVALLMSMVNRKQKYALRCSVLYCFQCFLYRNETNQSKIIQTLLPSAATAANELSAGQLLCMGLSSGDHLSIWFCSVGLSHALVENPAQKEELLRVSLVPKPGASVITLLQLVTLLLQESSDEVSSKLGILMLLSSWLSHCPAAIKQFLTIPSSVPYLTTKAATIEHDENEELMQGLCAFVLGICVLYNDNSVQSFTKESLRQLILKRIGLETYLDKLNEVGRHESYSRAAKKPQLDTEKTQDPILDFEFCNLFKALEGPVARCLGDKKNIQNGGHDHNTDQLEILQKKILDLESHNKHLHQENKQLNQKLQQLSDPNNLRSQMNSVNLGGADYSIIEEKNQHIQYLTNEIKFLKANYSDVESLKLKLNEAENLIEQLRDENMKMKKEEENLLELLSHLDKESPTSSSR